MTTAQETARLVASLPPQKAEAVLDFARYLAERADEEAWEKSFAKAAKSPKFKAFLDEARRDIAAGKGKTLDLNKL